MDRNGRNYVLHAMIYHLYKNKQQHRRHLNLECMHMHYRTDALECRQSEKINEFIKSRFADSDFEPQTTIITYDISEKCSVFNITWFKCVPFDELVSIQIKYNKCWWSDLFWWTQNISQTSIHHPQSIAFINLNTECGNNRCIILQWSLVDRCLGCIHTAGCCCIGCWNIRFNCIRFPTWIWY